MTLRNATGKARACGTEQVVELKPPDEQPHGKPAQDDCWPNKELAAWKKQRGQQRKINGKAAARARGSQARMREDIRKVLEDEQPVRKRHVRTRLRELLCKYTTGELKEYTDMAYNVMLEHVTQLAARVGAGEVGPGPWAMSASAAIQLAASRWLFDQAWKTGSKSPQEAAKLFISASRMADSSRQNMLAAHEICVRETQAHPPDDPLESAKARILTAHGEPSSGRSDKSDGPKDDND